MELNSIIKFVIVFLLGTILVISLVLTFIALKDHKASFKFYKSILDGKSKKDSKDSKK